MNYSPNITYFKPKKFSFDGKPTYFVKLAEIEGVIFVMKVTEHVTPEGYTDYKCYGYARLNGQNIADWTYWAIDAEEAEADQTREYLLRELIPLTKTWFQLSQNSVKFWSNTGLDLVKIWSNSGQNLVMSGPPPKQ